VPLSLRVLCARAFPVLPNLRAKPREGVEGVGTTLRTMDFAFHATVSALRYRDPFQPCHPERNFVIGKANDKVESKDPVFLDTTPGNARRSHRTVIARMPFLRVLCARVGTTLIARWAVPFTPRVPQMSVRKMKIDLRLRKAHSHNAGSSASHFSKKPEKSRNPRD